MGLSGVVVFFALGDEEAPPAGTIESAVRKARPAVEPFETLTETTLSVGGNELRLVIADDGDEVYEGLRRRDSIGPYDGMLFVYDDTNARSFTMSTVPVPLDIAFYDERGRVVNRFRMEPCPSGEGCPGYPSERPFRYALETLAGDLPEGRITPVTPRP